MVPVQFRPFSGKPVGVFDLDEVIFPTIQSILAWHNVAYGTNDVIDERLATYSYQQVWGCDQAEQEKRIFRWFSEFDMRSVDLLPGARAALREISHHFDLVIVSSRSPKHEQQTLELLRHHLLGIFCQVYLCGHFEEGCDVPSKGAVAQVLDAQIAVDDLPEHVQSFVDYGVPTPVQFGTYPWNLDARTPGARRIRDWDALARLMLA